MNFFVLIMVITISPRIVSMSLALIPILGIALAVLILIAKKYFEKVFEQYDKINQVARQNLSGIRVVKGFARAKYEKRIFKKYLQHCTVYFKRREVLLFFFPGDAACG